MQTLAFFATLILTLITSHRLITNGQVALAQIIFILIPFIIVLLVKLVDGSIKKKYFFNLPNGKKILPTTAPAGIKAIYLLWIISMAMLMGFGMILLTTKNSVG